MAHKLNVYAIPSLVSPEELAGGTVVVIDVLRATTTIVHALEAGANEVLPCLDIKDALATAVRIGGSKCILGGERGGLPIEGFHLGNSPTEYTPESVGGKTVVFTTTNGTRAMMRCRQADRVYLGAFVNASAVVERLLGEPQIHLLCAGSDGEITRDDVLLAGLLVERLQRTGEMVYQLNAQAVVARENWVSTFPGPTASGAEEVDSERLAGELRRSLAGQKLVAIGMEEDIVDAAQVDRFHSVPELDLRTLRIRLP